MRILRLNSPIHTPFKRPLLLLSVLLALQGCQQTAPANDAQQTNAQTQFQYTEAQQQLTQLMDEIWQYRQKNAPINATYNGDNRYNHLLPDLSPSAMAEHNTRLQDYIHQLEAINRQQLSNEDIINLDILLRQIHDSVDRYRYNAHHTPLTAESGFHASLAFLPSIMPFKVAKDFDNYISRLEALPGYFEQNIHWMKEGMKVGNTQPKAVLQGYENGISSFIVDDVSKSLYYAPVKGDAPVGVSQSEFAGFRQKITQIIKEKVIPAYQNYHDFMVNQYIPNARTTIGVSETPDGTAYYENRAKYYTTTDKSPEQIHQLGLSEVKRIRNEMQQIIDKLKFDGSFADFIHFLRTDKQFYATSAEQLLKEASYISKKMDAKLPALFKTLPRQPYGVAPVPDHLAPKYTTGRYVGSSRDDKPGYYWVNTYSLDKRPLYVLEALTLHEAVPGHHLQNALNREMSNVPPHRQYSYISAFGEGWGLYSEYLGIEAGFYQDPYSDFGRLTYEMWRACRLVVDTGMHVMGWSRDKAMNFLKNNTALSTHNVKTEIDRYITWPGQALSYKMGELTIKRLRREAEKALGSKFDIREFHDQVLKNGSVPLKVLEQQILAYIEKTLMMSL